MSSSVSVLIEKNGNKKKDSENERKKENEKEMEVEKQKQKEMVKQKEMDTLRYKEKRTPVPINEILALFSGYEDHLLLLLESVGEKMGNRNSEKIGNTTLELYLEKLDELKTDHDSELYKSEFICINDNYVNNDGSNNKNDNTNLNNHGKKYDFTTIDLIEKNKSESASIMLIIEDKIMSLLDGDIPYNK